MAELSNSDVALLQGHNGMFDGNSAFFWIFALLILAGGGFNYGAGGNRGNYVTQADLTAGLNNNAVQAQLQQISLSSANNNYETARLIQDLSILLSNQNNTNLINAIQGFNQMNMTTMNQTNQVMQLIQALSSKMDDCCCAIKTQMLQYRLDDSERKNVVLETEKSNNLQSQYLLGQLGRFVAWAGTGAPAAAVTSAG